MELTVVLAGIPVRLSLRSPAYAACFQPFWTEADPVAAVRVPEDALKEAAPHYEAGTTPEQVEYLELGPRVCDALLPYGRILFHGAAILWRGRVWVFTANSGTGKTTQYMLWKLCFGSEIKILNLEPSAAEAAGERHSPPHSSGLSHSHREGSTSTAPLRRAAGRRGLSDHGRMILKSAPTSLSGRFLWEKACNMGTIRV